MIQLFVALFRAQRPLTPAPMSSVLLQVLGDQRGWLSEADRLALLLSLLVDTDPFAAVYLQTLRVTGRFDTMSEAKEEFIRFNSYELRPVSELADTLNPAIFIAPPSAVLAELKSVLKAYKPCAWEISLRRFPKFIRPLCRISSMLA